MAFVRKDRSVLNCDIPQLYAFFVQGRICDILGAFPGKMLNICPANAPRKGIQIGGPAGEFPANIFETAKIQKKNLRANTNKKLADHGLTGGNDFLHDLFTPPLPPPP